MSSIEWQTDFGYAEDSAISTRKPILLDYCDLDCIGCQQMDAVTYPDEEVIRFVKENLVPMRIDIDKIPHYQKYNVIWTPTLLVLDYQGNEIQRTVGFLGPERFIPFMHLGIAKVRFANGEYDTAKVHLNILKEKYPESNIVPQAIYFGGVTLFKQTGDSAELKKAYEELLAKFPDSSWTRRAAPYRLL